jgi:hypothetical protein
MKQTMSAPVRAYVVIARMLDLSSETTVGVLDTTQECCSFMPAETRCGGLATEYTKFEVEGLTATRLGYSRIRAHNKRKERSRTLKYVTTAVVDSNGQQIWKNGENLGHAYSSYPTSANLRRPNVGIPQQPNPDEASRFGCVTLSIDEDPRLIIRCSSIAI